MGMGVGEGVGDGVGAGEGVGVETGVGVAEGEEVRRMEAGVKRVVAVSDGSLAALEQAARRTSARAGAPKGRALPRRVFGC